MFSEHLWKPTCFCDSTMRPSTSQAKGVMYRVLWPVGQNAYLRLGKVRAPSPTSYHDNVRLCGHHTAVSSPELEQMQTNQTMVTQTTHLHKGSFPNINTCYTHTARVETRSSSAEIDDSNPPCKNIVGNKLVRDTSIPTQHQQNRDCNFSDAGLGPQEALG